MRNQVLTVVNDSISSLNELLDNKIPIHLGEEAGLYGSSGVLDSLSLVNLIVSVEEGIENAFNKSVILASEKAMSQTRSPFSTIKSLVDYICSLLS